MLQDSKLLVEAVRMLGGYDEAGQLKVSWPHVQALLQGKTEGNHSSKSCRLRCLLPLP